MRGSGVCPFLFVSFIPSVDQELRVGFSLFLVWTVFAWLSRRVGGCSLWGCSGISRLSTVWPLPVLLRAGRERAIPLFGDGVVSVRGGAGA